MSFPPRDLKDAWADTSTDRGSQPTPLHLPADLEHKLLGLRRRRKWIGMTQAIMTLVCTLFLAWLAQGLADWFVELPWLIRAVFLAADGILLVWIYRRYFPRTFRSESGLTGVALLVESKWPDLRQCLISAVELCEGKPGTTRGSYRLALEVVAEARWKTNLLNFDAVVPWRIFRITILAGWIVIAATLGLMNYAWPMSGILLERILLSPISQTVVIPITKDLSVPVGSDVVLSVRTIGRMATDGHVTLTYAGQLKQDVPVVPDADHPDTFSLTVQNVLKPFTYQFHLNDGESPVFSVDAEVPPQMASIAFKVIYPQYTGLPPEERSPASLSILAGSRLLITATATQSLRSATIQLLGTKSPQTLEMTCDYTGKNLTGEIPIPAKDLTGFSVHLVNTVGFPSVDDMVYPVYPVPDHPPVVQIIQPDEERETVVPQANPVLVIQASDDYGIAKLVLKYRCLLPMVNGRPGPTQELHEIPLPIDSPKALQLEYTLDVAQQIPRWQEGWVVDYWVEATDNNDVTGPGMTRTKPKHFEIVSLEEKEREIAARLQEAANSLDSAAGEEDKISNQVNEGGHH